MTEYTRITLDLPTAVYDRLREEAHRRGGLNTPSQRRMNSLIIADLINGLNTPPVKPAYSGPGQAPMAMPSDLSPEQQARLRALTGQGG